MSENIYNNIFIDVLKRKISDRLIMKNISYSNRQLNGYCKKIIEIIEFSRYKKKFLNNKFDGFHIHSQYLKILKKNPLNKYFELFEKSPYSTYHSNTSKKDYNGYTHWYRYDKLILDSIRISNNMFRRKMQHLNKYEHKDKKYRNLLKQIKHDFDKRNNGIYLKIDKQRFLKEFKYFIMGYSDFYSTLLNNIIGVDSNFVYIDNTLKKNEQKLNGLGREYTLMSLMPKRMRKNLFQGYYEVDMSTAIQIVLVNLYYKNNINAFKKTNLSTLKLDFPKYYELISDKKRFREHYSSLFKCDYEKAKQIITSISYSPQNKVIYKYANNDNISSTLDKFGTKRLSRIKKEISIFSEETEIIRDKVLDKFYYQNEDFNPNLKVGDIKIHEFKALIDEDIRLHNQTLKGNGKGKKLKDRITHRLYELIEHQIRNKMTMYLNNQGINEVYQIHDGLIYYPTDIKKPLQDMREYIYKELDIIIQLEESIL